MIKAKLSYDFVWCSCVLCRDRTNSLKPVIYTSACTVAPQVTFNMVTIAKTFEYAALQIPRCFLLEDDNLTNWHCSLMQILDGFCHSREFCRIHFDNHIYKHFLYLSYIFCECHFWCLQLGAVTVKRWLQNSTKHRMLLLTTTFISLK